MKNDKIKDENKKKKGEMKSLPAIKRQQEEVYFKDM